MRNAALALALVGLATAAFAAQDDSSSGSATSVQPAGCIAADQVSAQMTPAELLPAAAACLSSDRIEDGFVLFAMAGVFGRFDARRVADVTARQSFKALVSESFRAIDPALVQQMADRGQAIMADQARHAEICATLRKLGPPDYYPRYMIERGENWLSSSGDGLIADFDPHEAFQTVLSGYAKCDPT